MKPLLITSKAEAVLHLQRSREKLGLYTDALAALRGSTPINYRFTFTIESKEVFSFDIDSEDECDTVYSYFVYLRQFFLRRVEQLNTLVEKFK